MATGMEAGQSMYDIWTKQGYMFIIENVHLEKKISFVVVFAPNSLR